MIPQGLGTNPGSVTTIWPYLAGIVLLAALALYSGRRRSVPGARYFAIACLFAVLWVAGAAAESSAADVLTMLTWFKFQAVWQLPAATAMTCFVLEYVYPGRWLTRRTLLLLSVPVLVALVLVLTNDLNHWMWRGFSSDGSIVPVYGTGYWILFGYSLCLLLVNITAFVWLFIRSPLRRWPVALMLVGHIASRALQALEIAAPRSTAQLDPSILVVVIPFGIYAIALFGFRILDPLPAAGPTAIEQMQEGMAVFDTGWQALSLNPAAERLLATPAARARGKPWQELLPSCPDPGRCQESRANSIEIRMGTGAEARDCALTLSPLQDHRGLTIGYLLLLHDVTEQRRAQALLLEQQWARAALQERELLAQELHDGLAQSLAFLNLQAQAAHLYLRSGQVEAAQDSLDRLVQVALEMQGDTRELMGNLLTVSLPSEGLCSAVRRAVARFEEQTGLPVSLEIADDLDAICRSSALPPAAGVQVLRILQESLANVRKHAGGPCQVSVRLKADAGQFLMTIVDDGPGFDLALPDPGGKHFGLQVMGKRAERIGGQLAVHSAPGRGTRVEVCVSLATGGTGRGT
jgi:signal transduction histidine kinase